MSDYIRLKYLQMIELAGLALGIFSIFLLEDQPYAYWLLVGGYGVALGIFNVLMAVTWPRFFGTLHLGAISGYALGWAVVASAIGPYFYSLSHYFTGNYDLSSGVCLAFAFILLVLSIRAENVNRRV